MKCLCAVTSLWLTYWMFLRWFNIWLLGPKVFIPPLSGFPFTVWPTVTSICLFLWHARRHWYQICLSVFSVHCLVHTSSSPPPIFYPSTSSTPRRTRSASSPPPLVTALSVLVMMEWIRVRREGAVRMMKRATWCTTSASWWMRDVLNSYYSCPGFFYLKTLTALTGQNRFLDWKEQGT